MIPRTANDNEGNWKRDFEEDRGKYAWREYVGEWRESELFRFPFPILLLLDFHFLIFGTRFSFLLLVLRESEQFSFPIFLFCMCRGKCVMETISIENVFDNVPRIGVMIPPGEARDRGYANGTWGSGGTPGFSFLSFLLLPSLSSLFSLFSSPSPLSSTRACVRKGRGRFFSPSPLSRVLPLFLSFSSVAKGVFFSLLPLPSPLSFSFSLLLFFPLSSAFSPSLSSPSLSSRRVSWRRKLLPSPGNRRGVVMGLTLVVSLQKIKVIWPREWRALLSLPE